VTPRGLFPSLGTVSRAGLLRSVRIHPPPYQGRLPAISLLVQSSRSHPRVAYKAQSVEPSPIHNTSCPFHVHPPLRTFKFVPRSRRLSPGIPPTVDLPHFKHRYPIRITNNTVKILLHPFIYPSIHPSAQVHHPDVFQEQKPKDISFSVPSNTHACGPDVPFPSSEAGPRTIWFSS